MTRSISPNATVHRPIQRGESRRLPERTDQHNADERAHRLRAHEQADLRRAAMQYAIDKHDK